MSSELTGLFLPLDFFSPYRGYLNYINDRHTSLPPLPGCTSHAEKKGEATELAESSRNVQQPSSPADQTEDQLRLNPNM